jgi:phospholipid-binding lipoprotein MlaA
MKFRRLLPLLLFLALAACATRPPESDPEALAEYQENNDPLEPLNRSLFAVHQVLDSVTLRPAALVYRAVVPPVVRLGVANVLGNLNAPNILFNDVLQGSAERAATTGARFLINSTLGIGGILDVAEDLFGLPGHFEDFGQTLGVWGLGGGPYIFVPLYGPTNPRDLVGSGVDTVASPWTWLGQGEAVIALRWARFGVEVVATREGVLDLLDELERASLDPYATIRSAYRQRRAAEIANRGVEAPPESRGGGFGVGVGVPAQGRPPGNPSTNP